MSYPSFIVTDLDPMFARLGEENCCIDRATALFLYTMVFVTNPQHVLEIGRYWGFSTACMVGALRDLGKGSLCSIDIAHQCPEWIDEFLQPHQILTLDSKTMLQDHRVTQHRYDLFFIDGDHGFPGVLQDLENTYAVSLPGSKWIIDDLDCSDVDTAMRTWLSRHRNLMDIGPINHKLRLIVRPV